MAIIKLEGSVFSDGIKSISSAIGSEGRYSYILFKVNSIL